MREARSWALRGYLWIKGLVLVAALFAVPAAAQITIIQWDVPFRPFTLASNLITEKVGSPASPLGAVWYTTIDSFNTGVIRFVPASPPESGPATWTFWILRGRSGSPKVTPDGVVFVRTGGFIERIDANTNLQTSWFDGLFGFSDLALDAANSVYTAGNDVLQSLTPTDVGGATLTRWFVGGGVGNTIRSGVAFNPTNGLIYYSEPSANNIGELDPATNTVRRFSLAGVAGLQPRQLAVDAVDGTIWAVTGNNQVIRLDPVENNLTPFTIPSANANPTGIAGGASPFIAFTETAFLSSKFGILTPTSGVPVGVTPSTATVTPTTSSINATPFLVMPISGTSTPAVFTATGTTTGDFIEVPLPGDSRFPEGVDCDPLGTFLPTWYFAIGLENTLVNRIARIEVQQ